MKRLDWYIIKKFLGTFFFSIILMLLIVVVFDVSEKIDDFIEYKLDIQTIAPGHGPAIEGSWKSLLKNYQQFFKFSKRKLYHNFSQSAISFVI